MFFCTLDHALSIKYNEITVCIAKYFNMVKMKLMAIFLKMYRLYIKFYYYLDFI